MKRQLLIFDLDGTLIDSRRDLATAVNLMRAHFALPPLPLETITSFVGDGVRALVKRALAGTDTNVDEAVRIQGPLYRAHLVEETTLYPGVADGLRALRGAGHVLAVATNKPTGPTETILWHFGLTALFAVRLGGGSTRHLKPDPEAIYSIMQRTRMAPADTWVIGDNHTDLEAARRAAVRSIFLTYGFGRRAAEEPTVTLDTFADLTRRFTA